MAHHAATWGEAITKALEANSEAGRQPWSLSALAREMAAADESRNAESWRNALSGIKNSGETVTERTAQLIAKALQVERSSLPPATTAPTVAQVLARLQALEELVEQSTRRAADEFVRLLHRIELLEQRGNNSGTNEGDPQ